LNAGYAQYYLHVVKLFENAKALSYAVQFGELAWQQLSTGDSAILTDVLSRLFAAAHKTSRYDLAFSALRHQKDAVLRDASLCTLLSTLIPASEIAVLLSFPYNDDLARVADNYLVELASKPMRQIDGAGRSSKSPYKILYAFRLRHNDLRGAASCLWDRLQVLHGSQEVGYRGADVDEEVAECYLTLINLLCMVSADQAWILTRPLSKDGGRQKRRVVTLETIRKSWQEELDRVADVAAGRFAIGLDWGHDDGETAGGSVSSLRNGDGGDAVMEIVG